MDAAIETLIDGLPDPPGARRFLAALAEKHPGDFAKLRKNAALLADVVTLSAFSPLLAATLLQNPEYLWWLNRKRRDSGVRAKEDILESLARFSLTHSQLEAQILFARFRRRELLRIYLRDIRRLATIAEITEEISNLADAILEYALKLARREMDNRYGSPREIDEKGRSGPARFCIAALGKLGSRELNYSSDIDLIFLYSREGDTSAGGSRGPVTNREYFVRLAEYVIKLVAGPSGEGAAYRVDVRLRPHGTLGALAMSVEDSIRYYKIEARAWERQAMIRSRGSAGEIELFKKFFAAIDDLVFPPNETGESALERVRRSKEKIDSENRGRPGFNVKLGRGGIREIEFLAQALQLAHGGRDQWLRSPHTLISLSRLADRGHISPGELSELSSAYDFLRRAEHVLQMENGVQTHAVPDEPEKRSLLARRVTFAAGGKFDRNLELHAGNVSRIYSRVFGTESTSADVDLSEQIEASDARDINLQPPAIAGGSDSFLSPYLATLPGGGTRLPFVSPDAENPFNEGEYVHALMGSVGAETDFRHRLAALRQTWSRLLLDVVALDRSQKITIEDAKRLQTDLAEASIAAALEIVTKELQGGSDRIAVLALGKLAGRGLDYESDLDLILVYDDTPPAAGITNAEFYSRAVELFITTLSAITRDGHLYRVDLRLRPYGSKGLSAISANAFLEYMRETAAVWEMLALVKLRAVGGNIELGSAVESETRSIIHRRALEIDGNELRAETRRARLALEQGRSRVRRNGEIDIKYGSGGMLDVYFAMRFLQLRDNMQDEDVDRSTASMLRRLAANGSLTGDEFSGLLAGYEFLSRLDHYLRLTVGRTTRLPLANSAGLETIADRMGVASRDELLAQLTLHRIAIREAFDRIVSE